MKRQFLKSAPLFFVLTFCLTQIAPAGWATMADPDGLAQERGVSDVASVQAVQPAAEAQVQPAPEVPAQTVVPQNSTGFLINNNPLSSATPAGVSGQTENLPTNQTQSEPHPYQDQNIRQPADIAAPKLNSDGTVNATFLDRHNQNLEAAKNKPDLVFLGDSITEHWSKIPDIFAGNFGAYNPANFGIVGDQTQHVLWRIENGELDGFTPKTVVLMIGTNNTRTYSSDEIVSGIEKIVEAIKKKSPETNVLLLGILPRGATDDPVRTKITSVNAAISNLDDGQHVFFRNFGNLFLNEHGILKSELMRADLLHLSKKGYEVLAEGLRPVVDGLMGGIEFRYQWAASATRYTKTKYIYGRLEWTQEYSVEGSVHTLLHVNERKIVGSWEWQYSAQGILERKVCVSGTMAGREALLYGEGTVKRINYEAGNPANYRFMEKDREGRTTRFEFWNGRTGEYIWTDATHFTIVIKERDGQLFATRTGIKVGDQIRTVRVVYAKDGRVAEYSWADATHFSIVTRNTEGGEVSRSQLEIVQGQARVLQVTHFRGFEYRFQWQDASHFVRTKYVGGQLTQTQAYERRVGEDGMTVFVPVNAVA